MVGKYGYRHTLRLCNTNLFSKSAIVTGSIGCDRLRLCVCVCIHISRCIQIMYKFQDTLYPLMHFPVQENMDLFLREIYYLNPEL